MSTRVYDGGRQIRDEMAFLGTDSVIPPTTGLVDNVTIQGDEISVSRKLRGVVENAYQGPAPIHSNE